MDHLAPFFLYLASEKGLSVKTLDAYKRDIVAFLTYTGKSEGDISKEDILSYIGSLHQREYAINSISRSIVAIRLFSRFLHQEGVIVSDPTIHLDTPKQVLTLPNVLSEEEINALFIHIDKEGSEGLLHGAILECLYGTGIRVSELCGLNLYDLGKKELRVLGKGNKERIVPIASRSVDSIRAYVTTRTIEIGDNPPLFVTKNGKRITRQFVWALVKTLGNQIGKEISPHTLRHSYASHLLTRGAEIRVIQELLGHVDIATTDLYTHISKGHLKGAFEDYHPRQ